MRHQVLLQDMLALIRHLARMPVFDLARPPRVIAEGRKLKMLRRRQKTALLLGNLRRHFAAEQREGR